MVFQCINIRQVPREVLKTAASGLGFQHLPRDLANVNAWKTMFDPYIAIVIICHVLGSWIIRAIFTVTPAPSDYNLFIKSEFKNSTTEPLNA